MKVGLLGAALGGQVLDDEVVDLLVELDHVVAVVVVVHVAERQLRVLVAYFDLDGVFLRQEVELLQRALEVLNLAEHERGDVRGVQLSLIAQILLSDVGLQLKSRNLHYTGTVRPLDLLGYAHL